MKNTQNIILKNSRLKSTEKHTSPHRFISDEERIYNFAQKVRKDPALLNEVLVAAGIRKKELTK